MRTLIIDGNHLLHRNMRVGELVELESHEGRPTGGLFGCLRSIHATLASFRAQQCIAIYDAGISKRRREILPEYKGARYRGKGDPFHEEMDEKTQEYVQKFDYQRSYLLYLLPRLGVRAWRFGGWEADDVIAALVDNLDDGEDRIVHVLSDDKDMLQLARESDTLTVNIIRAIAKQIVSVSNFEQIFGCGQQEYELRRIVAGDKSDNIPGIPGVGAKTIEEAFDLGCGHLPYEYPFEDLFLLCDGHKNKRIRKIADNIDIVCRNNDLMWLGLEDWREVNNMISCELSHPIEKDLSSVMRVLDKLDMASILKEFHNWVIPFDRLVE